MHINYMTRNSFTAVFMFSTLSLFTSKADANIAVSNAITKQLMKLAETTCRQFYKTQKRKCDIFKGKRCPSTHSIIKRHNKKIFNYVACQLIDNPVASVVPTLPVTAPILSTHYLAYAAFFKRVAGAAGPTTGLPPETITRLAPHYPRLNFNRVRIAQSPRLLADCMTDCHKIYCKDQTLVNNMRTGVIPPIMVHELVHAEQCSIWGGRYNYAIKWWTTLYPAIVQNIGHANRIHDDQSMERDAINRTRALCATPVDETCVIAPPVATP